MSDQPNLDALKQSVSFIQALLDDPHPGLFTWNEALNNALEALLPPTPPDRADDLEEELGLYRQMIQDINTANLAGAKNLARFRHERDRNTGPKHGEQVMPKVDGKSFRCDCGANVFTRVGDYEYLCNGCRARWQGEPHVSLT